MSIIDSNTEVIVQNGTEVATAKYVGFVQKYMFFARKTAENIIKLAETLVEAKAELTELEFGQFCREVGLDPKGSTFRKLKEIGEKVSRFEPFVEHIPSSWTTIYKLAKLDPDKFDRVMQSGKLSPFMTAEQVDSIISDAPSATTGIQRDLTIDLSALEKNAKIAAYDEIERLKQKFGFTMTGSEKFMKIVKSRSVPKALSDYMKQAA
jgi:hypothetical protein